MSFFPHNWGKLILLCIGNGSFNETLTYRQKVLEICKQNTVIRILKHARHALADEHNLQIIKVSHTNGLVIAVYVFPVLNDLGLEKQWLAFGQ